MIKNLLFIAVLLLVSLPAHAGVPEAREVARINNCTPKSIDVYQNQLGGNGRVVYQVSCDMPKTTDKGAAGGPDALLIGCDDNLCELIRPVALEKK